MATTTNKAVSSHSTGPEPRKPVIVDQGPEHKAHVENPNRATAVDRDILLDEHAAPDKPTVEPKAAVAEPGEGNPLATFSQSGSDEPGPSGMVPATGDPDSIANWHRRKGAH